MVRTNWMLSYVINIISIVFCKKNILINIILQNVKYILLKDKKIYQNNFILIVFLF